MIKTPIRLSFEEYLTYDDGTKNRYELVNGELVMVPLPTANHADAIDGLLDIFRAEIKRTGQPWKASDKAGVYIGQNPETGKDYSRTPDVCVMTQAQWQELKAISQSAAVLRSAPLLVVEVVSPGSQRTDYKIKPLEYAAVGVPEYWIVDLASQKVLILCLLDHQYQIAEFQSEEQVISSTFPELQIAAKQILAV